MSRRHELQHRLQQLGEIRKICSSMKSLAFLEVTRLEGYLRHQRQVVETIESCATDMLQHFPALHAEQPELESLVIVLGSERGFCGDYNVLLSRQVAQLPEQTRLVILGQKLAQRLDTDPRVVKVLAGPTVADEIPPYIDRLFQALRDINPQGRPITVSALGFDTDSDTPVITQLLPPFRELAESARQTAPNEYSGYPPLLNYPPEQVLADMVEHYLFALLYVLFYRGLMVENRRRVQHLDGAVQRIDDRLERLKRRGEMLRQEEITEEIEMLLLGVENRKKAHPA